MDKLEINGKVLNGQLVLGKSYKKGRHLYELCRCTKCGYEHYVARTNLLQGIGGCRKCSHYKHGLSRSRFHRIYAHIKHRCDDVKCPIYKDYGARGIKNRWTTFESFIDDMYDSYVEHCNKYGEHQTTIDRINVNGDYHKENCKWSTYEEQANNTRRTIGFEYKGTYYGSIMKACRELGVSYDGVMYRYKKGLTPPEAIEKILN